MPSPSEVSLPVDTASPPAAPGSEGASPLPPVDATPLATALAPVSVGEVVAGKYEVEKVLGVGGMGVVVAARHLHLQGRVALKFLLPHLGSDAAFAARFLREAQAYARLTSDHVVRVLDTGMLPAGHPYMVMECLEGCNLDDLLEARKRLDVDEAVGYLLQAMEAVAEAHAHGIVHRDLKLSNLFLVHRPDGSRLIKVLDFGISKSVTTTPEDVALTRSNNVLGSPVYMSPEQIRSARQVDARSDIWSLGIILHELVAGDPPFLAETTSATLAAVVADEPPALHTLCPEASPALSAVVLQCLQKKPADRYPDLAALAAALAPWAGPEGHTSIARITHLLRNALDVRSSSRPPADPSSYARRSVSQQPLTTSMALAAAGRPAARRWPVVAGVVGLALAAAFVAVGRSRAPVEAPAAGAAAPGLRPEGAAPRDSGLAAGVPSPVVVAASETPPVDAPSAPASGSSDAASPASGRPAPGGPRPRTGRGATTARGGDGASADSPAEPPAPAPRPAAAPAGTGKPRDMRTFFEDRR
ncbi:MAG: serine/threonine protein kinase [Myxococcales bacterium]|nr:MAG: serine/threonine protein kinase [Myxococcales bacterium]